MPIASLMAAKSPITVDVYSTLQPADVRLNISISQNQNPLSTLCLDFNVCPILQNEMMELIITSILWDLHCLCTLTCFQMTSFLTYETVISISTLSVLGIQLTHLSSPCQISIRIKIQVQDIDISVFQIWA